jgi:hypothetical protein
MATPSFEKISLAGLWDLGLSGVGLQRLPLSAYGFVRCCFYKRQFQFHKRSQLFIRVDDETLSGSRYLS